MATSPVLVCNMGSSSLKVTLYGQQAGGTWLCLYVHKEEGNAETLVQWLQQQLPGWLPVSAVLHRIVHAGLVAETPLLCDEACLQQIRHWSQLAPLHNPPALQLIESLQIAAPDLKQYAIFDSGLYQQLPEVARHYAIPPLPAQRWPVQRYGFHGLAHRSMWRQLPAACQQSRIITLQLGSGCSLSAWRDGRVIDNSMGFTPLEGVMMASRCGDIDAGVLLHLQQQGYDHEQLQRLLTHQSGLLGVSALSGDMRVLLANSSPQAKLAVDLYIYKIKKQFGAYIAVLGGVDVICFGGGVGENQPYIRQQVLAGLEGLGIAVDEEMNNKLHGLAGDIQSVDSKAQVAVRLVDEAEEMLQQYQATICARLTRLK